jgi:hypothetical protein
MFMKVKGGPKWKRLINSKPTSSGGKDDPCYGCHGTGQIGPLSYWEYKKFYESKKAGE